MIDEKEKTVDTGITKETFDELVKDVDKKTLLYFETTNKVLIPITGIQLVYDGISLKGEIQYIIQLK